MIKFGHWHNLYRDGPHSFAGRRFSQEKDFGFRIDMERYIKEKLNPIELKRGRWSDSKGQPTEGEECQLRAVIGGLGWAARQARPDEAPTASQLQ
eukprot:4750547-Pyramimonas_sp.AAC.1